MTTFTQLPGTLNLDIVRGDSVSVVVDFDADLTSYTLSASLLSTVSGAVVAPITAQLTSAQAGVVTILLTAAESAAIPRGTYKWELTWTSQYEEVRTALSGFVEVR